MSYARLDDGWATGTKMVRTKADPKVGDSGPAMWSQAVTHCNRELTDGYIHRDVLRSLVVHKQPDVVIAKLIQVRAFHDEPARLACPACVVKAARPLEPDEIYVHDFLDWNDTREQVEAKKRAKQDAGRRGGKVSGETRKVHPQRTENEAAASRVLHPPEQRNEAISTPLHSSPRSLPEPSEPLLPPAGSADGSARAPGASASKVLLDELRRVPKTRTIASDEWADELVMLAGSVAPAVLVESIRKAVASAPDGTSTDALKSRITGYVQNAKVYAKRVPREEQAAPSGARPRGAYEIQRDPGALEEIREKNRRFHEETKGADDAEV